jgi:quercetin dioxygenase-like cupin family protein
VGATRGWDPYPFILLNLALSFQAAYAAPVIMMSQNRKQDIDRKAAEKDYRINVKAELEIELLHEKIDQLREREVLKLTEAVRVLTELQQQSASRRTRIQFGRRAAVITRGYRLHGVTSFPIRRAKLHASRYVVSGDLAATAKSNKGPTIGGYKMSVQQPVLTPPHGGETVTSSGGSSVEMKVESSQSGGEYGAVMWTLRAGEEPPLHTHSREDELLYVVQGKLIARVGDARVEVGPGAYAALPRGVPHTIEVVGDQATLLLSFVPGGLERFLIPRKGEQPDPAAFGLTFP